MSEITKGLLSLSRAKFSLILLMCGDVIALIFALFLSLQLYYDNETSTKIVNSNMFDKYLSLFVSLALYIGVFVAFRLYRYAWRFASFEVLWGVISANTIGLLGLLISQKLIDGALFPRSVYIMFWVFSIVLVGGVRAILRIVSLSQSYGQKVLQTLRKDLTPKRIIILGGGKSSARLLTSIRDELGFPYVVIGFLDDMTQKHGTYIRDVKVLGPISYLQDLIEQNAVDEVLIAISDASSAQMRQIVVMCRSQDIPVKVVPAIKDVLNGKVPIQLEDISVEDLLRRPPVRIKMEQIGVCITGKRVLVTGAGGSIGSELCRQIMTRDPSRLILLGHGENSIHQIYTELSRRFANKTEIFHALIGSISDEYRMEQIFREHMPQIVFHAAAHKHVPIMESNLLEAVQNNVVGTDTIAECCGRFGVKRMVLISTDKAVHPACIMGATKWLAEQVVRAKACNYSDSTFVMVRFGNVLGSRGSVVPIFKEQIKRGGPVTITHPEMTRYFMSIPEAVQLVMQAGAIGNSGELYLLNMGEPIKIIDLAYDMIKLSGYEPEIDIPVVCTGMRPGEKLHERLYSDDELVRPAPCDGLAVVDHFDLPSVTHVARILQKMKESLKKGDTSAMQDLLDDEIPGFGTRMLLGKIMPNTDNYDPAISM